MKIKIEAHKAGAKIVENIKQFGCNAISIQRVDE